MLSKQQILQIKYNGKQFVLINYLQLNQKNYPATNTQSYIKNILENLSEPVNIQDVNIGLNYKITITDPNSIRQFYKIF